MIMASLAVTDPNVIFLLFIVGWLLGGITFVLFTHKAPIPGMLCFVLSLALMLYVGTQLHVISR